MRLGIWADPYYQIRRADRPQVARALDTTNLSKAVLLAEAAAGRLSEFRAPLERGLYRLIAQEPKASPIVDSTP